MKIGDLVYHTASLKRGEKDVGIIIMAEKKVSEMRGGKMKVVKKKLYPSYLYFLAKPVKGYLCPFATTTGALSLHCNSTASTVKAHSFLNVCLVSFLLLVSVLSEHPIAKMSEVRRSSFFIFSLL